MNKYFLAILASYNIVAFNPNYHGNDANASFSSLWPYDKERFIESEYKRYFPYYKGLCPDNIAKIDVSNINLKSLPAVYNQLESLLPYDGQGYYVNFQSVAKLFAHNHIKNALEVGSDLGSSTRHIASFLPKGSTMYAVDVWDNTTNEGYRDGRLAQFLSNAIHCGLHQVIIPLKQRSEIVLPLMRERGMKFDFIYIDGDHATLAVFVDLENSYQLLSEHGMMGGDDWLLKSVRAGVLLFAQLHNLTVYGIGNFWMVKDEGAFAVKDLIDVPDSVWTF